MAQHLYLTKVTHNAEKKEILVEFRNKYNKIVNRFEFYPFLVLPKELEKEQVQDLLLSIGLKGFQIEKKNKYLKIIASSFSELKKISNSLALHTGKKPLTLEAERQFLIQKNWTYFDSFIFEKDMPQKELEEKKDVGFLITKEIPFNQAVELDETETESLVEKFSLSALLRIPLEKVPASLQAQTEMLLENIFFSNGKGILWAKDNSFYSAKEFAPYGVYDSVSTIDFSSAWPKLITNNFFNLGIDTINCSCCKPIKLNDTNLLPSALIEVEFLEDAFYFESTSITFALKYHKSNPFENNRKEKKKEFFMKNYPVGPFFKNQKTLLPINDAKKLLDEKKVKLASNHTPNWFCKNKESFLSKAIRKYTKQGFLLSSSFSTHQNTLFTKNDSSYYFTSALFKSINALVQELPFVLVNPLSSFFSPLLANSILSVQEATLFKFREFSEKKGYRILYLNRKNAFIRGFSSLSLAKSFSKETSLPQPKIHAFSSQTTLG
ncbi:MAG: hypothetical protein HON47_04620 [Candidatus Diapherotrites archaeon]|jgi:hypothetical protein|uniref:Uncharacterized protein n=1 Tax=Candidatus Iainarchaeum sp. TaxID=3101447 RepID=A0A8T5GFP5_9ARCH|nr:hypothetical protein [Candidatus Diapherotrites archaeon]MBT7241344.1 hypothetical protein [Candidatus Diapherotrites archaeon]